MTAERLRPFGESIFSSMTRLANECGAINLSQGFPDFDGPDWLKEAACQAIRQGPNQYAPSPGLLELRTALAAKVKRDYDLEYRPEDEITVLCGATEALSATILGLLDPDDEVVLLEPFYDSYPALVAMACARPRFLTLRPPGFELDLEALDRLLGPRTRLLVLNSPNNPTGKVFSSEELEALAERARRHDFVVLSDEVYEHLVYPPHRHIPIATLPGMRERTVTVSSFSKTLSMTGWKVGYAMAPPWLTAAVRSSHQFLTFCSIAPLQLALARTLDQLPGYLQRATDEYLARRDLLADGLAAPRPAGTYFIVKEIEGQAELYCQRLAREAGVAAIPCSAFYRSEAGDHLIRFAFCKRLEVLDEAVRRTRAWRP
ncbi:MAG: aminotransferase [Candidatus Xenobia bacterium]